MWKSMGVSLPGTDCVLGKLWDELGEVKLSENKTGTGETKSVW